MEQTQQYESSGNGGRLIWILIAIALIIFASKNYLPSQEQEAPQPTVVTNTSAEKTTFKEATPLPKEDDEEDTSNDINTAIKDPNLAFANACGNLHHGYPNYDGTSRQGKTCADAPSEDRDLECIANPPKEYEGEVVLTLSKQALSCCVKDGTCQW